MLAKIIAHSPTRTLATATANHAIQGVILLGCEQTLASSPASFPTSRLSADSFIQDIWRKTRTLPLVTLLPPYRHSWHQLLS
ncbi:acetyl/propionyl-CoA carboxylase alpha subunit [Bradyrhizobium sp. LM6.11]